MDKVLTIEELQKTLKLGRNTTLKLVKQEGFPAIRVGKRIIVPAQALDLWLANNLGQEYNI